MGHEGAHAEAILVVVVVVGMETDACALVSIVLLPCAGKCVLE